MGQEQDQDAVLLPHVRKGVLGGGVGKIKYLLASQEALLGLRDPRKLHPSRRVPGDPAVSHGELQDQVQDPVDVPDGVSRQLDRGSRRLPLRG